MVSLLKKILNLKSSVLGAYAKHKRNRNSIFLPTIRFCLDAMNLAINVSSVTITNLLLYIICMNVLQLT